MTDLVDRLRQRAAAEMGKAPFMTAIPNYMLHREAADRIAELEAALRKINSLIDSPGSFNPKVQAVLDSVIDTSDVKFTECRDVPPIP